MRSVNTYIVVDGKVDETPVYNIYIIDSSDIVKVGVSKNVERRLEQINAYRFDSSILYRSEGITNGYDVESTIHKKLSRYRAAGREWYYKFEYDNILKIVKDTVAELGDPISNYQLATEEQIKEYREEKSKAFKEALDNFQKSYNPTEYVRQLSFVEKTAEDMLTKLSAQQCYVICYNGKIYINADLLYNELVDEEMTCREWATILISDKSYHRNIDYIFQNDTNIEVAKPCSDIFFNAGVAAEICTLQDSDVANNLRDAIIITDHNVNLYFPTMSAHCILTDRFNLNRE